MWIVYIGISLLVIAALVVAIIYAPQNCCGGSSVPFEYVEGIEGYLDVEEVEDNPDDAPRKYIGHRYDRDHDRRPTQYSQIGH